MTYKDVQSADTYIKEYKLWQSRGYTMLFGGYFTLVCNDCGSHVAESRWQAHDKLHKDD